ncbi:hypothetical protein [Actinophytocola algeriensis]|uniref:Uncharacterized protein n=1 Tax=Actinophytocola algeriensis TaxID=1768010 RepID=A0A7W7QER1_9PSEU|nr:hypothetical protein [Actinophytocola algeriensis]MBB4911944.1 hypothetical protein [Actinophytocola algeriensis]MBE1477564.1 hypothetical protein [Actinophytocola algeriensis]
MSPAEAAQPDQGPVLDTRLRGKQLHADPRVITYGRHSMALDEVEWVAFWAAHTATKRMLTPTSHHSEYSFEVGKDPYPVGRRIIVHEYVPGKSEDPPEVWTFLVNLAERYLVPRLLADLVDRVRRGETVTVGGSVKVNQDGIVCRKPTVSASWQSITRVVPYQGMVWIYQAGIEKPVLTVPLRHPNAGLMPALFAAFMP